MKEVEGGGVVEETATGGEAAESTAAPAHTEIPLDDDSKPTEADQRTSEEERRGFSVSSYNVSMLYVVLLTVHVGLLTLLGFLWNRPYTGLVSALCLSFAIPWVLAVYWWRRQCATNARVAEMFGLAFELGHMLVISQLVIIIVFEWHIQQLIDALIDISVYLALLGMVAYVVILSVLLVAIPDEIGKFIMTWRVRKEPDFTSRYGCIVLATATSMGFAACTIQVDLLLAYWHVYKLPGELWQWFLERLIPAMWMHLLCGVWTGIGLAKRYFRREGKEPYTYLRILRLPVLIHSIYALFFYAGVAVLGEYDELSVWTWVALVICSLIPLSLFTVYTSRQVIKLLGDATNYTSMELSIDF